MLGTAIWSAVVGAGFGLALAVPPGPMNAIIADETIRRGVLAGIGAGVGAMAADVVFFLLATVGFGQVILDRPSLRVALILAGGLLMIGFGVSSLRALLEGIEGFRETGTSGRGFVKTFLLGLTNPYQLAFWLTVGIGLLRPERLDIGYFFPGIVTDLVGPVTVETGRPALFLGFFAGIFVWIVSFPLALRIAGDRIDRLAPAVTVGSALILIGIGGWFLFDGISTLSTLN